MAQGHAGLSTDEIQDAGDVGAGDVISCLLQLFTVSTAFSGFHRHVPRAWSWQTDRQGDDQTTRPPVVKWTRRTENAVQIGRELTRRQARGHSSHQYGLLTGPVTTLTH